MAIPSYVIPSELSEGQVESDVTSYLAWCSPADADRPFYFDVPKEATTGADRVFTAVLPIYIQFKKSEGLRPLVRRSTRANKGMLETLREFRADNELDSDPALFFQLRRKAKTATDLQHNVLLALEQPPTSRGVYVAPLALAMSEYRDILFESSDRHLHLPFHYRHHWMGVRDASFTHIFRCVPFLRAHVCIPPRERVADHNHFYTFHKSGADIAWHSPDLVSRLPLRLSDYIADLFQALLTTESELPAIERVVTTVGEKMAQFGYSEPRPGVESSPTEKLRSYGRWLSDVYGIRQVLLWIAPSRLQELRAQAG